MRLFSPCRYVASVPLLDPAELWAQGKRALLVDRDNTLVPRDASRAPEDVKAWLDSARDHGFALCMISNNWHRAEVARSASELGIDSFIAFACKPLPCALRRACTKLGVAPRDAVLIGDQLYTDVWSANLAGIDSILVRPQTSADLWYTQVFRVFERRALRDLPCEE